MNLEKIENVIREGKYQDNWESLSQYQVPSWYKKAKFGLFSHYGVYTVPQYSSEWYPRHMYDKNSNTFTFHKNNYGHPLEYGYDQFIEDFHAEKFHADEWLDIVESSGAKYYIPVAEHHDGIQMYKSELSTNNTKNLSTNIDFISELQKSCFKKNIKFCVSSHRIEHIFFMNKIRNFTNTIDRKSIYWPSLFEEDITFDNPIVHEFLEDWLLRSCELVDKFSPYVFYFDWWIEMEVVKPYLQKFLAYYYNRSLEINKVEGVVTYKHDAIPYLLAVRDMERGQHESIQLDYWQCCTSISNNSWSYVSDNKFKDTYEIITTLIDIVSKNGNLLLNFGPHTDGHIIEEEKNILLEIGAWLTLNGEGIYDTHPFKIYGEGNAKAQSGNFNETKIRYRSEDFRFTACKNFIYIFVMQPEANKEFRVLSLGASKRCLTRHNYFKSVDCLDKDIKVQFNREEDYLSLIFNKTSKLPICVRIELY